MTKFIYRFRIPIIIFSVLITLLIITGFALNRFMGIEILKLESNAGLEALLPENNKDYKYFKEIEEIFGNMDTITIGVSSEDSIYSTESVKAINEFSSFLENRDEIEDDDVLSLTTVDNITADWGELIIEPLIDSDEIEYLGEYDLENIETQVKENPLFYNRLVSEDEKDTIIIANVPTEVSLDEEKYTPLIEDTFKKADELSSKYPNINFYVSGYATSKANISKYMQKDLGVLFLFALLTVVVVLYIVLREIRGMLIPVSVTIFSIIWTFGLKGLFKIPITITEIVIPVMLIAIGCADGVHIISEFFHFMRKGKNTKDALSGTLRMLTTPVILTSVTTSIGFFSLISAPGVSIKNMGIFLAFGVIVAMFFSLFFIPAILTFYKRKRTDNMENDKVQEKAGNNLFSDIIISLITGAGVYYLSSNLGIELFFVNIILGVAAFLIMFFFLYIIPIIIFNNKKKINDSITNPGSFFEKWSGFVLKYRNVILIASIIIVIISIVGIFNIRSETDTIKYFKKNDKFRIATEHINEHMGGISDLYIIFENDEKDFMKNPGVLNQMWDLQKHAESIEGISYTFSIADYIRHINYLYNENDEEYKRIPDEVETITKEKYEIVNGEEVVLYEKEEVPGKKQVANLLWLYEMGGGDALDSLVDDDYTKACVHVRINKSSTYELNKIIKQLTPYINKNIDKNVRVKYTNHYVRMITSNIITSSQVYSLIIALLAVAIILSIIFRSPIIGFITIIPTFIAIMLNFAVMWIAKVPLDVGTSTIASIGIGVGVDYAIHFFQRFKLIYLETCDYKQSVYDAIKQSARAIMSNALSVGLGFAVLMFSSFKIIFNLGWIVSLSMFTTAISALTILPAILLLIKPKVKRFGSIFSFFKMKKKDLKKEPCYNEN